MDPLSLSASIAGLISLADVVFRNVFKYARAVKDSRSDVQTLSDEICELFTILKRLEALALDLESDGDKFDPLLSAHHLNQFRRVLDKIDLRVKKALDSFKQSRLDGVIRRLKWPFTISETKELLDDLARHKSTVTTALSADSLREIQLLLTKSSEIGKEVFNISEIIKRVEINTQITVEEKQQQVLNYFMKVNPQPNLEMSLRLRHPMTGLWLTGSPTFTAWLENTGSRLWLSGIPGAGKTVLAGSMIQEALTRSYTTNGVGVGFFFCDYKNKDTWEPANIFGAIASQLARQKNEAFAILQAYYNDLHPQNGLEKTPDSEELQAKILQISQLFTQTIIVVDGLDECGDATDDVVDILVELAEYDPTISMAILSRNHDNIRYRLENSFIYVTIAAHSEDVKLYVGAELDHRIRTQRLRLGSVAMKDEIAEVLIRRADGMFRWVVCQIDYLCECAHDEERRDALSKLPPDLPESYRRLLERLNRCSTAVQTMVQKCLLFIAYSEPKLEIAELLQAVSTPDTVGAKLDRSNTITEREIMRRCSSLIRKSEDGLYLEFAHFSVQEFLEDEMALLNPISKPCLGAYLISRELGERALAAQCLRFLQLRNFDQCPTSEEHAAALSQSRELDFPFYNIAAITWLKLTDYNLNENDKHEAKILELMRSLFDARKTSSFITWAFEVTTVFLNIAFKFAAHTSHEVQWPQSLAWSIVIDVTFRPLHFAAALNIPELCEHPLRIGFAPGGQSQSLLPSDLALMSIIGFALSKYSALEEVNDWTPFQSVYAPSMARRNDTLDILFEGDTTQPNHAPLLNGDSTFSVTFILASCFMDFTPTLKLLAAGETPSAADMDVLARRPKCFHGLFSRTHLDLENTHLRQSTLALLMCLKDTFKFESDWGYRMCLLIWEWALEHDIVSTSDAALLDTRITISRVTLVSRALWAVIYDIDNDHTELKRCLADGRLQLADEYEDHTGGTLLHIAMARSSCSIVEVLLDSGYDPYRLDWEKRYPLHYADCHEGPAKMNLFSERGISLLLPDSNGYTVWHLWAQNSEFLVESWKQVLLIDREASKTALLTKSHGGRTPLSLIFEGLLSGVAAESFEPRGNQLAKARETIKEAHNFQGFWEDHPAVFGAAAKLGLADLVQLLVEAGAPPQPCEAGTFTPLHQLGLGASLECFELLLSLHPAAIDYHFEGNLPIDLYLDKVLEADSSPPIAILEAFIRAMQLWSTTRNSPNVIRLFKRSVDWKNHDLSIVLLTHGLDVHQRVDGVSSIEYVCGNSEPRGLSCTSEGRAFLSELFKYTRSQDLNEVGISGPGKGLTLLHILILNHKQRKDESSYDEEPDSQDSGPSYDEEPDSQDSGSSYDEEPDSQDSGDEYGGIPWLITNLVSRGLNVDSRCEEAETPLCYYLDRGYFQYAKVLLDLGADPTITASASSWGPAQYAVSKNNSAFLKKLLDHVKDRGITMPWEKSYPLRSFSEENPGRRETLWGANDLHLASCERSVKCLQLLLDEKLIKDVNVKSAEGYTPLHFALLYTEGDELAVMKTLLSNRADVLAKGDDGNTPLHFAAWNGFVSATKLLLDHGAVESFNLYGKTPKCYALQQGHDSVVQILEASRLSDASEHSLTTMMYEYTQEKREKIMASLLEKAIVEGDLARCKALVVEGCPIDAKMPGYKGVSPLTVALLEEEEDIITWLLNNAASVLESTDRKHRSLIEVAATSRSLTSVLPLLLTSYVSEGGDLVHGADYPIHGTIVAGNIRGLELLLKSIVDMGDTIARKGQIPFDRLMPTILGRKKHRTFTNREATRQWKRVNASVTALHMAVGLNLVEAVSLLVEAGADIEAQDSHSMTPLAWAVSPEMAECLLRLGASSTGLVRWGSIQSLMAWWGPFSSDMLSLHFGTGGGRAEWKLDGLFETKQSAPRDLVSIDDLDVGPYSAQILDQMGVDLLCEDASGRSLMHCIMCSDKSAILAVRELDLKQTTPFPWHLHWIPLVDMAFLNAKFAVLKRALPFETFRRILNLEPDRGWSPLCWAAALDRVDIIENCLSMKANIDFEGAPLGSALVVASVCESLQAVRCLTRHGAAIAYTGSHGFSSALAKTHSAKIRAWLLVGRFTEVVSLTETESRRQDDCQEMELRLWSGISHARIKLIGKLEQRYGESALRYAKRLGKWRKSKLGKVVCGF